VLLAIRDANVSPFVACGESLPAGLDQVVLHALARSPEDRFRRARDFLDRLTPYVEGTLESRQQELGQLVTLALAADPTGDPLDGATPVVDVDAGGSEPTPGAFAEPPRTAKLRIEYRIRTGGGSVLGPWHYAKVVEAIATGVIGVGDALSHDGGEFRPVEEISGLARHLAPRDLTPTQPSATPMPDEALSLADGGIVNALARAALRKDTGLWLCEIGEVRKEIYLDAGVPAFVTSNLAGELLGEYLVTHGVILRGELDMALAVMPRFEGRLGDTLTALGLVEPVHLFQHIGAQVKEKLLDLFVWSSGRASFYRGVRPPQSGFPLGLDAWEVLSTGIDRRIERGLCDALFADNAPHRFVRPGGAGRLDAAGLPQEARAVLAALDGPRHPRALATLPVSLNRSAVHRAIVLLLSVGAITTEPAS
jgi:serine/threonine-protein kinase